MATPTMIVGYLALFFGAGIAFLFINLLVGHFVRPNAPNHEKLEVYECGEPTIGSSFVQFDLRFYVVALLFIIFDVEVAFFFPWAVVFGKATHLMDPNLATAAQVASQSDSGAKAVSAITPAEAPSVDASTSKGPAGPLTKYEVALYRELGVPNPQQQTLSATEDVSTWQQNRERVQQQARGMAMMSLVDIGAFFAVLLVGFAYVWKRGDLDWVRAVSRDRMAQPPVPPALLLEDEPALSA